MRLRAEHGVKALRYSVVSVVNVSVSVGVLAVCHAGLGWSALWANLAAWLVSTLPAFLLSRAWVWGRSGPHRRATEALIFWVVALVGLGVSSLVVGLVEQLTQRTVLVVAGSLFGYGVVWVAKYLFLDKVVWPEAAEDQAPAG